MKDPPEADQIAAMRYLIDYLASLPLEELYASMDRIQRWNQGFDALTEEERTMVLRTVQRPEPPQGELNGSRRRDHPQGHGHR